MQTNPLLDILTNIPHTLLIFFMLTKLVSFKKPYLYIGLSSALFVASMAVFDIYPQFSTIKPIITIATSLTLTLIFSNDRLSRKLIAYTVVFASAPICEILVSFVWTDITKGTISYTSVFQDIPVYVAMKALFLLLSIVMFIAVYVVWQRVVRKSLPGSLIYFSMFPLTQFFLLYFIFNVLAENGLFEEYRVMVLALPIALIVSDALLILALGQLNKRQRLEHEAKLYESQLNAQLASYDMILEDINLASKIRHDTANIINTAYALFEEGNKELAMEELGSFSALLRQESTAFCANPIVNSLLLQAKARCEDEGITLNTEMKLPQELSLTGAEICSLFANILDNAVEAARLLPNNQGTISVTGWISKNFLVITERNAFLEAPGEEAAKAAKKDEAPEGVLKHHGLGLQIVSDIARRHGGKVETKREGGIFEIKVWIDQGMN